MPKSDAIVGKEEERSAGWLRVGAEFVPSTPLTAPTPPFLSDVAPGGMVTIGVPQLVTLPPISLIGFTPASGGAVFSSHKLQ